MMHIMAAGRRIATGILLLMMAGCGSAHMNFNWAKPAHLDMNPPPGPPEYKQGWKDGCNSGWKAYTTTFNKVWGKFEQDPKLAQNPVYYQVWKDAYAFCAAYAMSNGELGLMTNDGSGGGVMDVFGSWDPAPSVMDNSVGAVGTSMMPEWRNPFNMGVSQPEYNNPF